jgi:hypothetical protein
MSRVDFESWEDGNALLVWKRLYNERDAERARDERRYWEREEERGSEMWMSWRRGKNERWCERWLWGRELRDMRERAERRAERSRSR